MHRHPDPGIERHILDIFHVLRLAPGAVLRSKNGSDSGIGRLQQIQRVAQFGIDAGGMADHPDPSAANFLGKIVDERFEAGLDAGHRDSRSLRLRIWERRF